MKFFDKIRAMFSCKCKGGADCKDGECKKGTDCCKASAPVEAEPVAPVSEPKEETVENPQA